MDFKNFNPAALQKYFSAKGTQDLNIFLENLPEKAGRNVLIASGIIWAMAAALGVFTIMQTTSLTELRAQLAETKAIKPAVPIIRDVPVDAGSVEVFAESAAQIYRGLQVKPRDAQNEISSTRTADFVEFREALGHVLNGGEGWRVSLDRLCVGRECEGGAKLYALLKINKVQIDPPEKPVP